MDIKLWNNNIEDITKGYKEKEESYKCILCGEEFKKGEIYDLDNKLYDAYGAVCNHIDNVHGNVLNYFLSQDPSLIGISDIQKEIIKLMIQGKGDKEISKIIGIAQSTVRNHRFKLREKEKQAKLFIAFMKSLENNISKSISESDKGIIEEVHQNAKMVDNRFNIKDTEREKTIKAYIDETGAIKQFPSKEKKKIIILGEIMKNFIKDKKYNEKEVNMILARMYDDYATLRRALIEYGFLYRTDDCSVYIVRE